jgi:hypothetical protein
MVNRNVVKIAAWLEIVVGTIFIAAPDPLCLLVFDAKPEGIGRPLARWVGVVLLGLGIACLPSRTGEAHRTAVLGLFVFNLGLAILLAWVGAVSAIHGFALWPVVILHSVIAVALLPLLAN